MHMERILSFEVKLISWTSCLRMRAVITWLQKWIRTEWKTFETHLTQKQHCGLWRNTNRPIKIKLDLDTFDVHKCTYEKVEAHSYAHISVIVLWNMEFQIQKESRYWILLPGQLNTVLNRPGMESALLYMFSANWGKKKILDRFKLGNFTCPIIFLCLFLETLQYFALWHYIYYKWAHLPPDSRCNVSRCFTFELFFLF